MNELPKTKQQKDFEEFSIALLKILSEMTPEERKHIFNYVVFMYNK